MNIKNPSDKPNAKPCKNRDLMIPDDTARSAQRALAVAEVLLFWCAIAFGTNTAYAAVPAYPKGVWAAAGVDDDIPPELANNLGVVGVGVSEDWNVVNP